MSFPTSVELYSVITWMIDLSIARWGRMICLQKVVFPEPGGPTIKTMLLDDTPCSRLRETNTSPNNK
jgi:hypothetical protein